MEYKTTWCCPYLGCEWDVKIEYNYTPAQSARTNPDDNPCPAVDAEIDIAAIYRHEPYAINGVETGMHWVEWDGESEADLDNWKEEILELIKEEV